MSIVFTAIVFILIFSVLVLVHEWGHFYVARKAGIKVEEFGFGLPPRVWGFKKGEVLYSLNLIPFGGFVRLLGEDARDPKAAKNPKSFIAKSPRKRIMVVVAGVFMNFLLAFILLTIGFTFGIQPLIISGDDVFKNIENGTIEIQPGIIVKEVMDSTPADQAGLQPNDVINLINGREINSFEQLGNITTVQDNMSAILEVQRGDEIKSLNLVPVDKNELGFSIYESFFLPKLKVYDVVNDSLFFPHLNPGDIILKINDKNVYNLNEYLEILRTAKNLEFEVLRSERIVVQFTVDIPIKERIVIDKIMPFSPAEGAGFRKGDIVLSINNQEFYSPEKLVDFTLNLGAEKLVYKLLRSGQIIELEVIPGDDKRIGVSLSSITPYENFGVSFFDTEMPVSVVNVQNVKYPIWQAPVQALKETGRLSILTIDMFGGVIKSLITKFTVPEGVTGPVGIAQLTHTFIQEGILSLLRFVALLSLSLAIINILPFPALDGGRLFFILVEVVFGKSISAKHEGIIHTIGFFLLIGLIIAVTYSDIVELF